MKLLNFHTDFQLNGQSFKSVQEVLGFAKDFSSELEKLISDWFSEDDFLATKTSGSTGKPKTIRLQKHHVINSIKATSEYFDIKPGSRVLLCLPLTYIAGKLMVLRSLISGWKLQMVEPSSTPLKGLRNHYDFAAMVPFQLENSVSQLDQIKTLIVGGGSVSEQTIKRIQSTICQIYETYGMTETITHVAVKRLNHFQHLPSHFEALPNITILKDERDCLVINAPSISDSIIVTNDVVQLVSNNQFKWMGRIDNVINSGGIKLHPELIENKLKNLIDYPFFVTSQKDNKLGEKLILVIAYQFENRIPALIMLVKTNDLLGRYEKPKKIIQLPYFLETSSGKIKRLETLKKISPIFEGEI